MGVVKLSKSEIRDYEKYSSMLAGNPAFIPSNFEHISTTTLGSNVNAFEFSNVPLTYKHLQIRYNVRNASGGTFPDLLLRLMSDSNAVYASRNIRAFGSGISGASYFNETNIRLGALSQVATSQSFYVGIVDILDYSSTTKFKTIRALSGHTANGYDDVRLVSGLYRSTSALFNVGTFYSASGQIAADSTFSLYGIS